MDFQDFQVVQQFNKQKFIETSNCPVVPGSQILPSIQVQ